MNVWGHGKICLTPPLLVPDRNLQQMASAGILDAWQWYRIVKAAEIVFHGMLASQHVKRVTRRHSREGLC